MGLNMLRIRFEDFQWKASVLEVSRFRTVGIDESVGLFTLWVGYLNK